MSVFRHLGHTLRQLGGNLSAQLCGGGFGISYDQKIVDIGGADRIQQIGHKPVHQHLGLAGTGCGGHQQLATPIFHSLLLLRR